MASISSAGLGSGLDINGIITKLMQVESEPLTALAKKEASYQAKLTAFGTLKGALSSLQAAAKTLAAPGTFTGRTASASDSTVLSVSAGSSATPGTYDITVSRLAKANSVRTNVDYGGDTFDSGSLSISVGAGSPTIVTLTGTTTLSGIRDAINDARAGVSATILNDGAADRLVVTSNSTGSAGAINIEAPTTNNDGARRLTDLLGANLTEVQAAQDAELTVAGIAISRTTNTISDAIPGVTLNLLKADETTPATAKVTVARNTNAVTTAVNAFVKAYNDAVAQIKTTTAYDAANRKASVLTGDSTARTVQTQLNKLVSTNVIGIGGGVARLSDIGIALQLDGTLAVDANKLAAALADPAKDVGSFFAQTTTNNHGVAVRFNDMLERVVGSSGLIENRTDGIGNSIKDLQRRAETLQVRLDAIEKRYRTQFSALDSLIANMNQTSQYLSQQLANLPSASSSSK